MSTPPVPFLTRQRYEAQVRAELDRVRAETRGTVPPEAYCQAAHHIARGYPWADTRTVANTLVDTLGTGWGATYLHWAYESGRAAA